MSASLCPELAGVLPSSQRAISTDPLWDILWDLRLLDSPACDTLPLLCLLYRDRFFSRYLLQKLGWIILSFTRCLGKIELVLSFGFRFGFLLCLLGLEAPPITYDGSY